MEPARTETEVKKVALFLGMLQGLAYAILSLICIILHNQDARRYTGNSYMDTVSYNMYTLFLVEDREQYDDQILIPEVFTGFAWIYFFLHLGWLGMSFEASRAKGIKLFKTLTGWSYLTLLVSLWDFITVVVLGVDYSRCLNEGRGYSYNKINIEGLCATTILPALVIAAKGFVLWILNIVLALVLLKFVKEWRKGTQPVQNFVPVGYQVQQPFPQPAYPTHRPEPNPYVTPAHQSLNTDQFVPVPIPNPDYYNPEPQSLPRRY